MKALELEDTLGLTSGLKKNAPIAKGLRSLEEHDVFETVEKPLRETEGNSLKDTKKRNCGEIGERHKEENKRIHGCECPPRGDVDGTRR